MMDSVSILTSEQTKYKKLAEYLLRLNNIHIASICNSYKRESIDVYDSGRFAGIVDYRDTANSGKALQYEGFSFMVQCIQ